MMTLSAVGLLWVFTIVGAKEEMCPLKDDTRMAAVSNVDSFDQCTGTVKYVDELPFLSAELFDESHVWVAKNGADIGHVFEIRNKNCLATLAMFVDKYWRNSRDQNVPVSFPMYLFSHEGLSVNEWTDISDRRVYFLYGHETWMWPAIEIGYKRNVSGSLMTTLSRSPRVFLLERFVSDNEIDHIIEMGSDKMQKSPEVVYDEKFIDYRTSESGMLEDDTMVERIRQRSQKVARLPSVDYIEQLMLLRYQPGQWYKPHFDTFTDIPVFDEVDEGIVVHKLSPLVSHWTADMRNSMGCHMHRREVDPIVADFYLRQTDSDLFPRLDNKKFVNRFNLSEISTQGDAIDLHVKWIQASFCQDGVLNECVIRMSQILDDSYNECTIGATPTYWRNRFVTILPYLSYVAEGGGTVFPDAQDGSVGNGIAVDGMEACERGLYVPPIKNAAVMFYNVDSNSAKRDYLSLHGGCPPIKGIKYAINIFCWNINADQGLELFHKFER